MDNSNLEMFNMLEKVMTIKEALGQGTKPENTNSSENKQQDETGNSFGSIANAMKMIEIMQAVNAFNKPLDRQEEQEDNHDIKTENLEENKTEQEKPQFSKQSFSNKEEPKKTTALKYFDDPIHTDELLGIKAAIPYLSLESQRTIGVMVKLFELKSVIEMYGNVRNETLEQGKFENEITAMSFKKRDGNYKKEMLNAIRPHMPKEKQAQIELIMKLLDIKELLKKINTN